MKTFTVIIERCAETKLLVGHVPGFAGAHSQGETHEELLANLKEVVSMLLEDGDPVLDTEFVGTQTLVA
jgi:predicted RNase H-like HicB family nuclease